mmetsp:Transcript_35869/g.80983  ORF Transcript_35869/g.80983 Transcript_35869/m.80983 type:complete len:1060 (+) Transcript_35869:39-3218(+)
MRSRERSAKVPQEPVAVGARVRVLPGRRFQSFAEGDVGTVVQLDGNDARGAGGSNSCLVKFDRYEEVMQVALRHLEALQEERVAEEHERAVRSPLRSNLANAPSRSGGGSLTSVASAPSPCSTPQKGSQAIDMGSGFVETSHHPGGLARRLLQETFPSAVHMASSPQPVGSSGDHVMWNCSGCAGAFSSPMGPEEAELLAEAVSASASATATATATAMAEVTDLKLALSELHHLISRESEQRGMALQEVRAGIAQLGADQERLSITLRSAGVNPGFEAEQRQLARQQAELMNMYSEMQAQPSTERLLRIEQRLEEVAQSKGTSRQSDEAMLQWQRRLETADARIQGLTDRLQQISMQHAGESGLDSRVESTLNAIIARVDTLQHEMVGEVTRLQGGQQQVQSLAAEAHRYAQEAVSMAQQSKEKEGSSGQLQARVQALADSLTAEARYRTEGIARVEALCETQMSGSSSGNSMDESMRSFAAVVKKDVLEQMDTLRAEEAARRQALETLVKELQVELRSVGQRKEGSSGRQKAPDSPPLATWEPCAQPIQRQQRKSEAQQQPLALADGPLLAQNPRKEQVSIAEAPAVQPRIAQPAQDTPPGKTQAPAVTQSTPAKKQQSPEEKPPQSKPHLDPYALPLQGKSSASAPSTVQKQPALTEHLVASQKPAPTEHPVVLPRDPVEAKEPKQPQQPPAVVNQTVNYQNVHVEVVQLEQSLQGATPSSPEHWTAAQSSPVQQQQEQLPQQKQHPSQRQQLHALKASEADLARSMSALRQETIAAEASKMQRRRSLPSGTGRQSLEPVARHEEGLHFASNSTQCWDAPLWRAEQRGSVVMEPTTLLEAPDSYRSRAASGVFPVPGLEMQSGMAPPPRLYQGHASQGSVTVNGCRGGQLMPTVESADVPMATAIVLSEPGGLLLSPGRAPSSCGDTLALVCGVCGNVFRPDALYCRKCGARRPRNSIAWGGSSRPRSASGSGSALIPVKVESARCVSAEKVPVPVEVPVKVESLGFTRDQFADYDTRAHTAQCTSRRDVHVASGERPASVASSGYTFGRLGGDYFK